MPNWVSAVINVLVADKLAPQRTAMWPQLETVLKGAITNSNGHVSPCGSTQRGLMMQDHIISTKVAQMQPSVSFSQQDSPEYVVSQ